MCPLGVLCCVCAVLGHLAPVHRCSRLVCCVASAVSWVTWLLFTGVHAPSCALLARCPGPLGSCSLLCPLGMLCCVRGVLGNWAPVHRCARSVCCVACAVSWASWLLFTGVPPPSVAVLVRCPWPLGSCSPVCRLGCCVACTVSWATLLLFTGVPARCVVLRVRCPGPLGSCSLVCPLGVLCCVCLVVGHLAPVHPCSYRCVALRVRCPGPLPSCSLVCPLRPLLCWCGVLGHLAPVNRCARSVCCTACTVSWTTWLLFTGVRSASFALLVCCPGPLGSCSPVCPLGVLCCVCSVPGLLAPVHRCARLVCCVACTVSRAPWLLFTSVLARCAVLGVRCPGPPGSCSPVCSLCVLCCGLCARGVASGRTLVHPHGGCS